jgi:hypothetical protein
MSVDNVADELGREAVSPEAIRLGGISPSWLADQLDEQGVLRLRDVFSNEWLEAMRASVTDRIARHGDGDFLVQQPDDEIGSPAHRLMSEPTLHRLFEDATRLRRPKARSAGNFQCHIHIRNGMAPKAPSNLFHYDFSVMTMVIPIFIPHATVGNCGELAAFGNKRPFRRFVATHLVDKILTHNSLYRRHLVKKVNNAPEKYLVDLEPGDAYVFWGYRHLHGNLECAPGLLRATLVLVFDEVHSDSWALKLLWRFSRSRRDIGRFEYSPTAAADSESGMTERSSALPADARTS